MREKKPITGMLNGGRRVREGRHARGSGEMKAWVQMVLFKFFYGGLISNRDSRTAVCPVAFGQLPYSWRVITLVWISLGEDIKARVKVQIVNFWNTSRGLGNWIRNLRRKVCYQASCHCGWLEFSPSGEALAVSVKNAPSKSSYPRSKGAGVFMHERF